MRISETFSENCVGTRLGQRALFFRRRKLTERIRANFAFYTHDSPLCDPRTMFSDRHTNTNAANWRLVGTNPLNKIDNFFLLILSNTQCVP